VNKDVDDMIPDHSSATDAVIHGESKVCHRSHKEGEVRFDTLRTEKHADVPDVRLLDYVIQIVELKGHMKCVGVGQETGSRNKEAGKEGGLAERRWGHAGHQFTSLRLLHAAGILKEHLRLVHGRVAPERGLEFISRLIR
jgi:hypothetical protein